LKSIASAPGKIILFGEHFVVHGTKAILAAIDKRVTVTSSFTENKTIKVNSELGTLEVPMSSSHEEVKSEFRPFIYLANKMINSHQDVNGLEITINSDIPIGVGLGSSSACCVAATASICALFKEVSSSGASGWDKDKTYQAVEDGKEERTKISRMSREAEETIFPDTSGADCKVCQYGGIIGYHGYDGTIVFHSSAPSVSYEISANLLIVNSMIQHSTKRSVEKVRRFKENNEKRFSELCDLANQLIDHYDKLGRDIGVLEDMIKNDVTAIGLKMTENQKYLEEIQVSNDTLRDMISSLKEISLGTKITGAGDGGCIIALVKDENLDKVPALLPKDKEYFSAKIDTKGVVWKTEE
jgi:mevalonate kinase